MQTSAHKPTLRNRLTGAWRALTGRDAFAGTYGVSTSQHGFAGGAINRLTSSLANWSGSINADNDLALPILRARARSLAANNEHGKRFLSLVARNVVGRKNPQLQVRAMMNQRDPAKPTQLDKSANDAIEVHFERWGRTADVTGRHKSIYALERTIVKAVARDGECLIRKIRNRALPYGLGLQLLEADRLDETINQKLSNGNTIRQGVEVDSIGRAVAYYVKTAHPGENYAVASNNVERVPAGEMIHLFLSERAEQVRGVTWLHAVIVRASIIHKFEEAAVIAAQIGASKVAALERSEDSTDSGALGMADGTHNGTAGGIPQMNVEAGDLADVNFSTGRIGENAERDSWMILQDWFIESFCMPIYEEWLAIALLNGAITFEISGKALPADKFAKFFNASRFQGRRWQGIDPVKEAEADKIRLENLLTSRTRLASEQGDEFDDIIAERQAEGTLIKTAGLEPAAPPAPPPPKPEPDPALNKAMALLMARAAAPAAPPAAAPSFKFEISGESIREATREAVEAMVENGRATMQQIREDIQAMPIVIPAPVVHVAAPNVTVENHVEASPVTLEATIQPAEVNLTMPARRTDTSISYNLAGEIVSTIQIEKDA